MKKRAHTILFGIAFMAFIGFVGTVERGGSPALLLATLPCLAVMWAVGRMQDINRKER